MSSQKLKYQYLHDFFTSKVPQTLEKPTTKPSPMPTINHSLSVSSPSYLSSALPLPSEKVGPSNVSSPGHLVKRGDPHNQGLPLYMDASFSVWS